MTVDASGTIASWDDVDPFGMVMENRSGNVGQSDTRYKLIGAEMNPEMGMYQLGPRWYDQRIGLFRSPDPMQDIYAEYSPYHYGFNNPMRFVDPTGLGGEEPSGIVLEPIVVWGVRDPSWWDKYDVSRASWGDYVWHQLDRDPRDEFRYESGWWRIRGQEPRYYGGTPPDVGTKGVKLKSLWSVLKGLFGRKTIMVSAERLAHVLSRHTFKGGQTAYKSVFAQGEDVVQLIKAAERVEPTQQASGHLQRVVDAGRIIGTDVRTGQPTSIYTVITNASNNLITAFPGLPLR